MQIWTDIIGKSPGDLILDMMTTDCCGFETIDLRLNEMQMENSRKQSLVERYGKINIIMAALCAIFLIVNSVIVSLEP